MLPLTEYESGDVGSSCSVLLTARSRGALCHWSNRALSDVWGAEFCDYGRALADIDGGDVSGRILRDSERAARGLVARHLVPALGMSAAYPFCCRQAL